MNIKRAIGLTITTFALNMGIIGVVHAASVDVKCEVRGITRSKISVDGAGLGAGLYRASAKSGTVEIFSKAFLRPVAGEVEFDFDSNPADVRAGATAVPAAFIKNRTVTGKIYSFNSTSRTYSLRAAVTEICKAK